MYRQKNSLTLLYERVVIYKAILISNPASVVIVGHYRVMELLKHEAAQASHPRGTTGSCSGCVGRASPYCNTEIILQ